MFLKEFVVFYRHKQKDAKEQKIQRAMTCRHYVDKPVDNR